MDSGEIQKTARREIGKRIMLARQTLMLTRACLAAQLGAKVRSVQAWETGERSPIETIGKVAHALRTTPEWLLDGKKSDIVNGPDNEVLLRVVETFGETYHRRKKELNRAEKALYESAVSQLLDRVLPPQEAATARTEHASELDAQRQRAAVATAAAAAARDSQKKGTSVA